MDGADFFVKIRKYQRERRAELLNGLVSCTDIEKQRGRIIELDTTYKKIQEIFNTTGDDDATAD